MQLEKRIQADIINSIREVHKDVKVWRNAVGGTRIGDGFMYFGLGKGSPDVVCVYKGMFFGIEVKTAFGVLEPHQEKCHKEWNEFGISVYVCRTTKDALDAVVAEKQKRDRYTLTDLTVDSKEEEDDTLCSIG